MDFFALQSERFMTTPLFCFLLYFPSFIPFWNSCLLFVLLAFIYSVLLFIKHNVPFLSVFVLLRLTPAEFYNYPCCMTELGSTSTADTFSHSCLTLIHSFETAAWRLHYFSHHQRNGESLLNLIMWNTWIDFTLAAFGYFQTQPSVQNT